MEKVFDFCFAFLLSIFRPTALLLLLVQLIVVDDLRAAPLLVQRKEDLVHARITLLFVHELYELIQTDKVLFTLGAARTENKRK